MYYNSQSKTPTRQLMTFFLVLLTWTINIYTNQTERFPITSSRNNKYIMIAYDYSSNKIDAEYLKSRLGHILKTAYEKIHKLLNSRGLKPRIHLLDNECAESFKAFMKDTQEKFHLALPSLPHIHRRNAEEHAIQTFKKYCTAGLASVNKNFPMYL